jgi:hypothetical protein
MIDQKPFRIQDNFESAEFVFRIRIGAVTKPGPSFSIPMSLKRKLRIKYALDQAVAAVFLFYV